MAFEQVFLFDLLVAVFGLIFLGRFRHDVGALFALLAAGVVPFAETFSGFGHPATVTVALVLVISRGFKISGAVDLMGAILLPPIRSASGHVASLACVTGALSAVMNNVRAHALLMPAGLQSEAKIKRSPLPPHRWWSSTSYRLGTLYESIDWTVVVLLAAMIPIGAALDTFGERSWPPKFSSIWRPAFRRSVCCSQF